MPMAEAVASYFEWWLNSIKNGNSIESATNYNNVISHSRNILEYVDSTPQMAVAMERAIRASQGYFLQQQNFLSKPSKEEALGAMQALSTELDKAKPSDVARALGLG